MSYFFLIVPPAVIIGSLAIIIYMALKKSKDLEKAEQDNPQTLEKLVGEKIRLRDAYDFFVMIFSGIFVLIKKLALSLLAWLGDFYSGIREKRKNKKLENRKSILAARGEGAENLTVNPEDDKNSRFKSFDFKKLMPKRKKLRGFEDSYEEEEDRPMVKEEMVLPDQRKEDDGKELEERLIGIIADNPKDIRAYEKLGIYYYKNGNFKDSLECYKQILKLNPSNRAGKIGIRKLEKMIKK